MKKLNLAKIITGIFVSLFIFNSTSFAEEKTDCSKINNKTLMGNIKYVMCKRGSDKLDADGNLKTKNPLKKLFKKIKN